LKGEIEKKIVKRFKKFNEWESKLIIIKKTMFWLNEAIEKINNLYKRANKKIKNQNNED